MTYTLDTSTCITFLRGKHPQLRQRVLSRFHDIAITSVVAAELYYGAERSADVAANRKQVDAFLAPFPLLPLDKTSAVAYGSIRADLARRGQIIGPNDLLIAAIALATSAIVVTHNTGEFSRVPGLLVEDWLNYLNLVQNRGTEECVA